MEPAGLTPPGVVTDATAEYEQDCDPLAEFLAEASEVVPDSDSEVSATELYTHYRLWADRRHLSERERLTSTAFGRRMGARFQKRKDAAGTIVYAGIARRPM